MATVHLMRSSWRPAPKAGGGGSVVFLGTRSAVAVPASTQLPQRVWSFTLMNTDQ